MIDLRRQHEAQRHNAARHNGENGGLGSREDQERPAKADKEVKDTANPVDDDALRAVGHHAHAAVVEARREHLNGLEEVHGHRADPPDGEPAGRFGNFCFRLLGTWNFFFQTKKKKKKKNYIPSTRQFSREKC